MADRSIIVKIGANVTGLVSSLKTADKAAQDFGNKFLSNVEKNSASLNTLSRNVGIVGAGLTGLAVLAVKKFADFDQAMSAVGAATMETAGNMELLRQAAIDAGADTQYSATEAAKGVEELAKAGVSTTDILKGGLAGSLNLAASGAISVGDAAEIAATAMTQFGLKGTDVTHISDLLAAGAGKAQGGVGDLGMALKQAGLVANSTGLSIEETTAGLTAFASAGLIGSDAGTSFKAMLQRLTPQSAEAQKAMDDLGISAYDSQGNFIGLAEFAGNLQDSLKDLTPEQRNSAEATIFGSDAVRAANILYEEGEAGIRKWTAAVDDQGYAAEQAAIRTDNLKGDLERLSGSFETALIGMGEAANGPLRDLVQGLDGMVDRFNGMSDGAKGANLAIVGGGGLVLLGVAGFMKLTTSVSETVSALKTMGVISEATSGRIGAIAGSAAKIAGVAAGLAAAGAAVAMLANALTDKTAVDMDQLAESMGRAATASIDLNSAFKDYGTIAGTKLGRDIQGIGDALDRTFNKGIEDKVNDTVASMLSFTGVVDTMELLDDRWTALDTTLGTMVSGGNLEGAYAAFQQIKGAAESQGVSMDELREKFPEYFDAVSNTTSAVESATPAQDEYNAAMDTGGASATTYADALKEALDAQKEQTDALLTGRDAQRDFEGAVDDARATLEESAGVTDEMRDAQGNLTEEGRLLVEQYVATGGALDITTEKGRANQEALDGIASSGAAATDALRENGGTQEELAAQVQSTRDQFILAAEAFGMSADEANALADEMNLIPANVTPVVAINDQASGTLDSIWSKITRLSDRTITVNTRTGETSVSTGSGNYVAKAAGGRLPGAPSMRDNMLIHAASGEYVVNAMATQRNLGVLEAINSGATVQARAGGGEVYASRQYVAAPQYATTAPVVASSGSQQPLYGSVTMVAADPRAALREFQADINLKMAGGMS